MLAKNETTATVNATVNATQAARTVRSRKSSASVSSSVPNLFAAAQLPARPVAAAPSVPAKPRMSLAEFQAQQSAATAVNEQIQSSGDEVADLLGGMSEADVLRLLAEYERCSIEAKKLYERRDMIEADLLQVLKPGDIIKLTDGRTAYVVDNFAPDKIDKKTGRPINKVWRVAGVSHYEIEFTKAGK